MNGIFNDDPLEELSAHVFMKMLNKIIKYHWLIVEALKEGDKAIQDIITYLKDHVTEINDTRKPYNWKV